MDPLSGKTTRLGLNTRRTSGGKLRVWDGWERIVAWKALDTLPPLLILSQGMILSTLLAMAVVLFHRMGIIATIRGIMRDVYTKGGKLITVTGLALRIIRTHI